MPGGRQGLRLKVKVGCPRPEEVDVEKVQQCFPYGQVQVEVRADILVFRTDAGLNGR